MASGVWLGAEIGRKLFTFSYLITRNTRATTMSMTNLWTYQASNAVHLVSKKRFYTSEKRERFDDLLTQDVGSDGATEAGSVRSESSQDEDDPVMQDLMVKYERYRLWLAKIMGKDPEKFGDKDIKETIEYLMPSGLYAKDARPLFEDPKRLYKKKAELVDKNSRPLHAAFFTGQIGFHDLLFEIYEQNAILDTDEKPETIKESEARKNGGYILGGSQGSNLASGKHWAMDTEYDLYASSKSESSSDAESSSDSDPESTNDSMPDLEWDENSGKIPANDRLVTQGTMETESAKSAAPPKMRWIGKLEMEKKIGERLTDKEYDVIIHRLKKLASHPNASRVTPFLLQFLHVIAIQGMRAVEKKLNDKGEAVAVGHRKRAIAEVVMKKGSGSVTVNNTPMAEYFRRVEDRKQIMYPFLTVDAVGEYDVDCGVIGGGTSGQAGAIRLALSRALLNFEDSYLELLQEAGLLIRDPRIKERKKPGQKRARKKFAWVRR